MWAFLDPNDNSKVVLVMSTQGFIVSSEHFGMAIFDHNIRYRFEIENTGDAKPDAFVDVTYSPGLGRLTGQTATITLPNGKTFTAPTTIATQDYTPQPPVVTTDSATGVSFFAGNMDDPFFLDDTGANRFVASSLANPGHPDTSLLGARGGRDTYAGFNSVSIPQPDQTTFLGQIIAKNRRGTKALYMGMSKEREAFWIVACSNGKSYEILIRPDSEGSARRQKALLICEPLKAIDFGNRA